MVLHRLNRIGALALTAFGTGLVGVGYAGAVERRWLHVTRYQVPLAGLPDEWEGLRIAHLSDLHLNASGAPLSLIQRAIDAATVFRPDLIALTGDFTEDGALADFTCLAPLVRVAPTFAVFGNHDYFRGFAGADTLADALTAQGITLLRNELTAFVHDGVAGIVVGFDDDVRGPGADVQMIVDRMRGRGPTVVLAHEPDVTDRFPPQWAGLTLAGHTHGGQVRLSPFRNWDWVSLGVTEMKSRYLRGWYTVNGNRLYVSRGLGVARYPLRFAARPELALFTLTGAKRERA